jgi:tetratricopeptide (TPR) repeat protein
MMGWLAIFAAPSWAGPVSATGQLPPKIEELENAQNLLAQGKGEEAYKQILEAKKKYPALSPPRLILYRMVHRMNPRNSRPLLEQAAAEEPDHPEIYLTLASVALAEGRVSETLLNAQKALDLADASRWTADQKSSFQREARAALATACEARRDWPNARTHFAAWLELDPKNSMARQRYGSVLFQLDKPDEALLEFQTAAKDDATLLPPTVMMARQYMAKNDNAKATEFFDKAVKQEANNARVHVAYADYLLQQGKLDEAKLHVEEAAKQDAKNIDVRRMRGLVARFARDNATAQRVFQEIMAESPADFMASNQLSLILADMNDDASKKRALQLAEVNYRQYQDNLEALSTLAYSYLRNSDLSQAQKALETLIRGSVGRPIPLDTSYVIAAILAENKEGIEDAKKVLKSSLDASGIYFFKKEAKALLDKLERDYPTKAEAAGKEKDKAKGN